MVQTGSVVEDVAVFVAAPGDIEGGCAAFAFDGRGDGEFFIPGGGFGHRAGVGAFEGEGDFVLRVGFKIDDAAAIIALALGGFLAGVFPVVDRVVAYRQAVAPRSFAGLAVLDEHFLGRVAAFGGPVDAETVEGWHEGRGGFRRGLARGFRSGFDEIVRRQDSPCHRKRQQPSRQHLQIHDRFASKRRTDEIIAPRGAITLKRRRCPIVACPSHAGLLPVLQSHNGGILPARWEYCRGLQAAQPHAGADVQVTCDGLEIQVRN